ncbi:MAG: DUF6498-containing protein [bacterium]|nr:DUF6498-containing protein [bacterium]
MPSHSSDSVQNRTPAGLIRMLLIVALSNAVPVVGVVFLGWSAFHLVVLLVTEAVIVLLLDFIKRGLKGAAGRVEKNLRNQAGKVLFFETVFILFFGMFALIVYGRGNADHASFSASFGPVWRALTGPLRWPLALVAATRIFRLFGDLRSSGVFGGEALRPLTLDGGGWMLLMFFSVMLAPFLADSGPNPRNGLFALVALKTIGECVAAWAAWSGPDGDGKKNSREKEPGSSGEGG